MSLILRSYSFIWRGPINLFEELQRWFRPDWRISAPFRSWSRGSPGNLREHELAGRENGRETQCSLTWMVYLKIVYNTRCMGFHWSLFVCSNVFSWWVEDNSGARWWSVCGCGRNLSPRLITESSSGTPLAYFPMHLWLSNSQYIRNYVRTLSHI